MNVSVPDAMLSIYAGSESSVPFSIGGLASFHVGGSAGFKLTDFRINNLSLFGTSLLNIANPPAQPLTAVLVSPAADGVINRTLLNGRGYIDVQYPDLNGKGIQEIDGNEFQVFQETGGTLVDVTAAIDFQSPVKLFGTTYRYPFSGSFPGDAEYAVQFLANRWNDGATPPNQSVAQTLHFVAFAPATATGGFSVGPNGDLRAPPTAKLVSPVGGSTVDPDVLNSQKTLDVSFQSRDGDPIDPTTLQGTELALSGTADINAKVQNVPPIQIGANTYRYFLLPVIAGSPLFGPGTLNVTFKGGKFAEGTGATAVTNLESTEMLTLDASKSATATTSKTISLGPLVLVNPSVSLGDFGFSDGKIDLSVTVNVGSATLAFGGSGNDANATTGGAQSGSGVSATLTGILGTFQLGIGLPGNFSVSPTGKFSLAVSSLVVEVPNVVNVTASGILVQYDPMGDAHQELVRINSASITFEKFDLTGTISPFNPHPNDPNSVAIPGLVVRRDGFTLGQAELIYGGVNTPANQQLTAGSGTPMDGSGKIKFGSILTFNDLRVGVTNFTVNFSTGISAFNGSIFFATGGRSSCRGTRPSRPRSTTEARPTTSTPTARPTPRRCGPP